jgi:hypothetical protein
MGARAVTAVKKKKEAQPAGPVFLSTGLPDPQRDPRFPADITAIREAIRALATVVLPRAPLVLAGHPALTPFVRLVASSVGEAGNARLYTSVVYTGRTPPEDQTAPDVVVVRATADDAEGNLRKLRDAMLKSEAFAAGVFIGGMEASEQEIALFKRRHPTALILPVASTGGAAKLLFDQGHGPTDAAAREALASDTVYGALFTSLLGYA